MHIHVQLLPIIQSSNLLGTFGHSLFSPIMIHTREQIVMMVSPSGVVWRVPVSRWTTRVFQLKSNNDYAIIQSSNLLGPFGHSLFSPIMIHTRESLAHWCISILLDVISFTTHAWQIVMMVSPSGVVWRVPVSRWTTIQSSNLLGPFGHSLFSPIMIHTRESLAHWCIS
jgi:hypothetical protein